MSLKDLLPEGTYDEIDSEAHHQDTKNETQNGVMYIRCPSCGRKIPYTTENPFRPFCSERCKLLDLGAWANEERTIKGRAVDEDEDADLLNDPSLPKRF